MTTLCALLLSLAGATLVYLSSKQQQLLASPLSRAPRLAGWAMILGSFACWSIVAGTGPGITAALTALMLAWVLLPYLAWWRKANQPGVDKP